MGRNVIILHLHQSLYTTVHDLLAWSVFSKSQSETSYRKMAYFKEIKIYEDESFSVGGCFF